MKDNHPGLSPSLCRPDDALALVSVVIFVQVLPYYAIFFLQICCEINRYCYRPTFNTLFLSCLYQQPDLLEMMLLDPFSLLSLDAPVSQVSW